MKEFENKYFFENYDEVMKELRKTGEPAYLLEDGKRMAVAIPYETFKSMGKYNREIAKQIEQFELELQQNKQ